MKEPGIETLVGAARDKYADANSRILSDNGPQFIARDFKEYIGLTGRTHVRSAPYYPQSNGRLERFNETVKVGELRPASPRTLKEGLKVVGDSVESRNGIRLRIALGDVTPSDILAGRHNEI